MKLPSSWIGEQPFSEAEAWRKNLADLKFLRLYAKPHPTWKGRELRNYILLEKLKGGQRKFCSDCVQIETPSAKEKLNGPNC